MSEDNQRISDTELTDRFKKLGFEDGDWEVVRSFDNLTIGELVQSYLDIAHSEHGAIWNTIDDAVDDNTERINKHDIVNDVINNLYTSSDENAIDENEMDANEMDANLLNENVTDANSTDSDDYDKYVNNTSTINYRTTPAAGGKRRRTRRRTRKSKRRTRKSKRRTRKSRKSRRRTRRSRR